MSPVIDSSSFAGPGDQSEQVIQGREVGKFAQTSFPAGASADFPASTADDALTRTAALVDNLSVPAIFEAAFRFEGITIRADILERQPGNR